MDADRYTYEQYDYQYGCPPKDTECEEYEDELLQEGGGIKTPPVMYEGGGVSSTLSTPMFNKKDQLKMRWHI